MDITEVMFNDVLIVKVSGRLDSNTFGLLEQKMKSLDCMKIILDFSKLEYISSAGLRIILMNAKKMKKTGGHFRLCCMKEFIKEIFDIAGFSRILNIDDTLENSIEKF